MSLIWDRNAARWCLTKGILWGTDHWKKSYEIIASIPRSMFFGIDKDLIQPTNSSDPLAPPLYNTWHVWKRTPKDLDVSTDVTCANGAGWVRDYLLAQGVSVTGTQRITRVEVNVEDVDRVGPESDEWSDVVSFYQGLQGCFQGASMVDNMLALLNALPLKYAYEPSNRTHPYLKLKGLDGFLPEKIRYKKAPIMWGPIPGPNGPIPAPPPPPAPPLEPRPFYNKPDDYLRCQPGEELFQVPILDGEIARVCAPTCPEGPPDGTCPDAPSGATGFWDKPNCNNPNSIIPGSDCVLRCDGLLSAIECDGAGGAECFGSSGFGLLGVCMYRMTDDGSSGDVGTWLKNADGSIATAYPYPPQNNSLVI